MSVTGNVRYNYINEGSYKNMCIDDPRKLVLGFLAKVSRATTAIQRIVIAPRLLLYVDYKIILWSLSEKGNFRRPCTFPPPIWNVNDRNVSGMVWHWPNG